MKRLEIKVEGEVQGIGFRPHVYRLATELGLTGFVYNNADGVTIEVQGTALTSFLERLKTEISALTVVDRTIEKNLPTNASENTFTIKKSVTGKIKTKSLPDSAICKDCLEELFNPDSHYYHYPFINCTHCGPRYTITHSLPYDRQYTSMLHFPLCPHCKEAYENPLNRRYHAQSIACTHCGPQLSEPINKIASAITSGKIIALKGLGGFQLICDANNKAAARRLRAIKKRETKPFAIMTLNTESAKNLVHCSCEAEKCLTSKERPIVILPKKDDHFSDVVAPNLNALGVMLPYTATHYLLFYHLLGSPKGTDWLNKATNFSLIITSANHHSAPIIKDNQQANEQLTSMVDMVVSYNRDIVTRVDDSVLNLVNNTPCFIRRARGFSPRTIALPHEIPSTLALGPYLKNTICITRGREAFLSQHIGKLNNAETLTFYHETIKHLLKLIDVKPECIACDLHPDFYSTKIATEFKLPVFQIQHHHAHLASCAVENLLQEKALGVALDGFGLGKNHESWGGELLHYSQTQFKRLGSLKPLMQPGGDIGVKQAWRMAASVLFELGKSAEIKKRFNHHANANPILTLLENQIRSPLTSSCGRLFDAASAVLGICEVSNYEGQAAMELESCVNNPNIAASQYKIQHNQLNLHPLFYDLLDCNRHEGADLFHATLITGLTEWIIQNAEKQGIKNVLMSGGCFLNRILTEGLIEGLKKNGLIPFISRQVPPNDGGLSLGQAWIAGNKFLETL